MLQLVRKTKNNKEVYINGDGSIEENIDHAELYSIEAANKTIKKYGGSLLSDIDAFPQDYKEDDWDQ